MADYPPGSGCKILSGDKRLVVYSNVENDIGDLSYKWSFKPKDSTYHFETVTLHEIGHIMGIWHCDQPWFWKDKCDEEAVMEGPVEEGYKNIKLKKTDKARIRQLYSDRLK